MNEEQIKLNAEAYAEEHAVRTDGGGWEEEYDYEEQEAAYIAGAHSRDEEIEILKHQLNNTSINLKIARAELDQLRNPWISVKERLPEKEDGKFDMSAEVLVRTEDYPKYIVAAYDHRYNRWWATYELEKVTHWQPIKFIQQ